MNIASIAFAMGPPPGGESGGGNPIMAFLPLIIIFAIFYFLMIKPQQKRAKEHRNFLDSLRRGDEVMTAGGIIGRISGLTEQVVTLEVADNVKIKVARSQISGKPPGKGGEKTGQSKG
ncbi:MAG TPA: preprotein translocase subunit YajC [Thermodesulfobacteriaceae bacterium]|nr:preprotein translocase subunit YajC [Thermodesulfobacteriaceae bacterium]